jgi:hypothetical protein
MAAPKTTDRRTLLTSTVTAWAAVTLGGCSSDDDSSGGTAGMGGAGTGGTGGATGGSAGSAGSGGSSAGMTTGGSAGMGGSGPMYVCQTDTANDTHSHPLTIPGSDVALGEHEDPYLLEDGGTGHTHTLYLSAYDFLYLQAGVTTSVESSETLGHTHICVITCPLE